jgi:hypothetical protein
MNTMTQQTPCIGWQRRRTAMLMAFEASTLAVMSVLHVTRILACGERPFMLAVRIDLPWHQRLVDDMVDAYAQWRHECKAVKEAYEEWSNATAEDESLAFGAYEAALDREDRSSQLYADLVQRVSSSLVPDHQRGGRSWRAVRSRMRCALSHRRFRRRLSSDLRTEED